MAPLMALVAMFAVQDTPLAESREAIAPVADEYADIVVTATYGRTTMLFDKGTDGKLYNCRVLVSSGSQARDTRACGATPVCFAGTADEVTDCTPLTVNPARSFSLDEGRAGAGRLDATGSINMPRLLDMKPVQASGQVGPRAVSEPSDSDRQRLEKLPPPPSAPEGSGGPVIRLTNGQD